MFPLEMIDDTAEPWLCCGSMATLYDNDVPFETPAYAVVSCNLTQVMELAASGAYDRPSDAWTIYEACLQGHLMIQALSTNAGLDLNPVILGQMGDRVFHFLLRTSPNRFSGGKLEVIRKLLQHGVDPLEADRFGNTALHTIAELPEYQQSGQLMNLMLGNDAPRIVQTSCLTNIDSRNGLHDEVKSGNTALHVAVLHNNEACVKILLEGGASPHLRGVANKTPLSLAIAGRCTGIAHLLLAHGAIMESEMSVSPEMTVELSLLYTARGTCN
jgi:hypothetical protein